MKTLIKSEFLYYLKNRTKLIISVLFIASFVGTLFVYDNLELSSIQEHADIYRGESYWYRNFFDYADFDNFGLTEDFFTENFDENDPRYVEMMEYMKPFSDAQNRMYEYMNGYATLYAGGRMNVELTVYRKLIVEEAIRMHELIKENDLEPGPFASEHEDLEALKFEHKRLTKLFESETPDDFNKYTVTLANYPSKVFEGFSLFVIITFVLLLFYDLFSRDFVYQTYKTIYTQPYPRKNVITAKVTFATLHTLMLTAIGMAIVSVILLLTRRVGYNILPTRIGYMFHPHVFNINPLTIFGMESVQIIIPLILKNLLYIVNGLSIVILWILLVSYTSLKIKSSESTLTIWVFGLLSIFFINNFPIKDSLAYVFPIFGYEYGEMFSGNSNMNIMYLTVISIILSFIVYKMLSKDITTMDLTDGDNNG